MGRPAQQGLSSFPHSCSPCQDDIGLEVLSAMYGPALAYTLFYRALEMVYAAPGCSLSASDTTVAILARRVGIGPAKAAEMLEAAALAGLFDKGCYRQGVVTSRHIQRAAARVFAKRQRERNRYHSRKIPATENWPETPRLEVFG